MTSSQHAAKAPAWTPEHVVSPALARRLIERQFPKLVPVTVRSLSAGWDNTAYLVNEQFVFRFPRRKIAVEFLKVEQRVLPAIAGQLSVPVPNPMMNGEPDDRFPWPFVGYEGLPGHSADCVKLTPSQRSAMAIPLARFLVQLHGIPVSELAYLNIPEDRLGRLDLEKRASMARKNLQALVESGRLSDATPWMKIIDETDLNWTPGARKLVHGDLYARHLLVDRDTLLCGVIDWGDVHLSDPAVDLSIAHAFLPPENLAAFRDAYGPVDDGAWQVARFRALYHATVTLDYGHSVSDEAMIQEGMTSLRHLSEAALA